MEGSSLLPPLMMMKGDFLDVEKKFYLVVADMFSLWWRHTVIKDEMMALRGKVLRHGYQLIVT